MRYRAWLDTTPTKHKVSRSQSLKRKEEEDGLAQGQLELPPVPEAVEHLVGYLYEVGPTTGEHPVPFSEIAAWQSATGAQINEFEAVMIRTLSQHYLGSAREALDPKCPAPVLRRDSLPSREAISNALGDFLRSFNSAEAKAARAKRQTEREKEEN